VRLGVDWGAMKKTSALSTAKLGPGEYRPDIAFTRLEDLPRPKIIQQRRNYESRPCPHCRKPAPGDQVFSRQLHAWGDLASGRRHELHITYLQHYCSGCRKYFNADGSDEAPPHGHYTHGVMRLAVRLVAEEGLPYRSAGWTSGATIVCLSPLPPSRTGWRLGEKGPVTAGKLDVFRNSVNLMHGTNLRSNQRATEETTGPHRPDSRRI